MSIRLTRLFCLLAAALWLALAAGGARADRIFFDGDRMVISEEEEPVSPLDGSLYTPIPDLAARLSRVLHGEAQLFADGDTTDLHIGSSVGTARQGCSHVIAGTHYSGYECFIYANAVYAYLFGEVPYRGDGTYRRSVSLFRAVRVWDAVSWQSFYDSGVCCGAYIRTTAKRDGAYSHNGHSIILLTYDEQAVTWLDANLDNRGTIALHERVGWDEFRDMLSGGGRILSCVVTPTDMAAYTGAGQPVVFSQGTADSFAMWLSKSWLKVLTLPEVRVPDREDSRFLGWSRHRDAREPDPAFAPGGVYTLNRGLLLWPVWERVPTYAVGYFLNSGRVYDNPVDSILEQFRSDRKLEGSDYRIIGDEPTLPGRVFLGWSRDPAAAEPDPRYAPGSLYSEDAPLNLFAVWQSEAGAARGTVVFGQWEQDGDPDNGPEPLTWQVLDTDGGARYLLCDRVLEIRAFGGGLQNWERSSLRAWLNGDFFRTAFTEAEQARIARRDQLNLGNDFWVMSDDRGTSDPIFLPSLREIEHLLPEDADRIAAPSPLARRNAGLPDGQHSVSWWLRTNGVFIGEAMLVREDGSLCTEGVYGGDAAGVRPALWLGGGP